MLPTRPLVDGAKSLFATIGAAVTAMLTVAFEQLVGFSNSQIL